MHRKYKHMTSGPWVHTCPVGGMSPPSPAPAVGGHGLGLADFGRALWADLCHLKGHPMGCLRLQRPQARAGAWDRASAAQGRHRFVLGVARWPAW